MEFGLRDYFRILRKRRWVLVLSIAACIGGSSLATVVAEPEYQSEALLRVGQNGALSREQLEQGVQVAQLSEQLLQTYAQLVQTRPVAQAAITSARLPLDAQRLSKRLDVQPLLDTQLIRLRYRSKDPELAQRVVNAVALAFEADQRPSNGGDPAVGVQVVEPALRSEVPVRPRPIRNLAVGLVGGLMLGVALAFLREHLDVTVKTSQEIEEAIAVPVLATVPRMSTQGNAVHLERDSQSSGAEAFRKLRTALQFLSVDHPLKVLLITSAFAQEGKTTTSLNLAAAFANAGLTTMLVEADLRRPTLHRVFPIDPQRGLTTCLIGRVSLEDALQPTPIPNLTFVPAGAIPPNPVELLASVQMADVLRQLKTRAEVVLIDAPPLLPVADASALASRVDGTLLVARSSQTSRDRLREASELVGKVGGRLLGVVLNYQKAGEGGSGYYYYGYKPPRGARRTNAKSLQG